MRQPVPFGKYLLLDRISVGGMAEVFKAKSYGVEGFEKIIAIKRILPTMGEDRDFIKMFIDEAKIAGQLAHANICQIFELGRIDGAHFIAMEYIWGKDLLQIQNRLRKNKVQMPIPMACFCIAKVLEGLDYAHRKRDPLGRPLEIVHRDCSPQNVLVSYEGEVKVIDFGIAKATSRNSRTMAGVLKGKFGYMSPEQVRGLPLDRRSDIFAIGTMLYESLTGERLFQGETDFSTLEKVRNVDIQPPRSINPAIPEAVEKVILKALAKDVDDRYQWCSEMLTDLQAFLMSQDVVFTAKTLSQYLKEVFQPEIDRERQLLEQYKRVGRDGLIAGTPAAQARGDINENLGKGEAPDSSDATQLGGPDFDEMEQGIGAAPDVNQSPAAGGQRGMQRAATPAPTAPTAPTAATAKPSGKYQDDANEGDFGEEAPTEIFGDDIAPPAPASGQRPSSPANARTATPAAGVRPSGPGLQHATPAPVGGIPRTPVPGARPNGPGPAASPSAADSLSAITAGAVPNAVGYAAPYGTPQAQSAVQGLPGASTSPHGGASANGLAKPPDTGESNRTVLGMTAPAGLGSYGAPNASPNGGMQAPTFRPSQPPSMQQGGGGAPSMAMPQNPAAAYGNYPQQSSGGSGPQQSYPGYQQPYPAASYHQQPYQPPPGYAGYPGSGQHGALPHEMAPERRSNEGKRSTLARDIGIGIGIAALVLVGFLVVKLVILGDDTTSTGDVAAVKLATVRLRMPASMTAEMFVDDMRVGTVAHDQSVGVKAGVKHIKLVGNNGVNCDEHKVTLEAGRTTTLECGLAGGSAGSASPASGSGSPATGSATPAAGSGSAGGGSATASMQGSGSGAKSMDATKPVETKPDSSSLKTTTKPADTSTKSSTTKSSDASQKTATTKPADTSSKSTTSKSTDTSSKTTSTTKPADTSTKSSTKVAADKAIDSTKGYLQIYSKPQAKILVDGNDTGLKTPIGGNGLALSPGKHKITFVIGDDRFTYPVVVKAGATDSMSKDLQ